MLLPLFDHGLSDANDDPAIWYKWNDNFVCVISLGKPYSVSWLSIRTGIMDRRDQSVTAAASVTMKTVRRNAFSSL